MPVTIQIAEIHAHREPTGLADRRAGDRTEAALAVADPPIIGDSGQRLTGFIAESAAIERHGLEHPFSVVHVKAVGLTVFGDPALGIDREPPDQVRFGNGSTVDRLEHGLSIHGTDAKALLELVPHGGTAIAHDIEVEVSVAVDVRQRERTGAAPSREP